MGAVGSGRSDGGGGGEGLVCMRGVKGRANREKGND